MTNQETFDIVVEHLLRQGGPSMMPSKKTCAYRGTGGRKCAAGVLISDEDYTPYMEHKAASTSEVVEALAKHGHDPELVRRLQIAHDESAIDWNDQIVERLKIVAECHQLDTSIFDRVAFVPEANFDADQ